MKSIRELQKKDLPGVLKLTEREGWPSFTKDPERAWRVCTAPGVIAMVAEEAEEMVGFIQMQTDTGIQAHLTLILVSEKYRRKGIGKKLIQEAFKLSGAERVDLVTDTAPEFYRTFFHRDLQGFRIYPQYKPEIKSGKDNYTVRTLVYEDIGECKRVLYSLPKWFGIEASNRAYIESLQTLAAAVAVVDGRIKGFIALFEHTPKSWEIHVLAVEEKVHRQGLGKALIQWAESWCKEKNAPWLHVKTRGPATPDPHYDRTRLFYLGQGFEPIFESLTLWGPENAALVMIKKLG